MHANQDNRTWHSSTIARHIVALVVIRLIRSWNQTGQKFAGEPDTVKLFMSPNPQLLWVLITLAYATASLQVFPKFHDLPYIVVASLVSVLVSSAITFKLAFTAEDSPELVTGLPKTLNDKFRGQSLVSRARVVFAVLAFMTLVAVYQARTGGSRALDSGERSDK